jgi:DNA-binding NarL/FixJ family response regulator
VAAVIRAEHPTVSVVLLTMHKSRAMLEGALNAGARGYVLKENADSDVVACLHVVAEGGTYVSPGVAHHLVDRRAEAAVEDPVREALGTMTPTEWAVLRLVAAGRSTREIAAELGVRAKTVEHHRSHICVKLGITGINALVRFAAEHRALIS